MLMTYLCKLIQLDKLLARTQSVLKSSFILVLCLCFTVCHALVLRSIPPSFLFMKKSHLIWYHSCVMLACHKCGHIKLLIL